MNKKTYLDAELASLHAEQQVVQAVTNLGHHDHDANLFGGRTNVVLHVVVGGEGVKGSLEVFCGRLILGRGGSEVDAHEEALEDRVGELLQVEDVVAVGGEEGGHCVDDAWLVRARQSEDVIRHCMVWYGMIWLVRM